MKMYLQEDHDRVWIRILRHTNMTNTISGFCEYENRISRDKIRRNSFMPEKAQSLSKDAAP